MNRHKPKSQKELVKYLEDEGYLWEPKVRDVLLQVDRGHYCRGFPYQDGLLSIGHGACIAAPHLHAYALQKLERHLVEGARALDVGAGSGYLTVCMALMVGETGQVVGVEHIPQLLNSTLDVVGQDKPSLLKSKRLKLVEWDGRNGYYINAPYNAIHVGAAVEKIPDELVEQLAPGGRMLIPVGPEDGQTMVIVDKDESGRFTETNDAQVRCIPLTDVKTQLGPLIGKEEIKTYGGQGGRIHRY